MKFRKKPVVIDAVRWFSPGTPQLEFVEQSADDFICHQCKAPAYAHGLIRTLESGKGAHIVCPGDWIITGIKGEHYACKPDIFEATYEAAL